MRASRKWCREQQIMQAARNDTSSVREEDALDVRVLDIAGW